MATMPSSPPRRIHSRPSSRRSSNSSQYSFDLDALMPPEEHESSSLDVQESNKNAINVLHSEDIEGPSDFTQNMEYWMSAKLPTVVEPTRMEGAPKKDMEDYVGSEDTESTAKHMSRKRDDPLEADIVLPLDERFDPEKSDISYNTPTRNPGRGISDTLSNDISDGEKSTPRTVQLASPPSRPIVRQATVEDYEDTPLQPVDMSPSPRPNAFTQSHAAIHGTTPNLTGSGNTEAVLEKALNQLRQELDSVRAQVVEERRRQRDELEETKFSYETKLALLQASTERANLEQAKEVDGAEALKTQKEGQIRILEARVADQDEKLEEAQGEILTLGKELEELASEKSRINDVASSLLTDHTLLQERHNALQDNCAKLVQTIQDLENNVESATHAQMHELQRTHDLLQDRHAKLEQTVQHLEAQCHSTRNEHLRLLEINTALEKQIKSNKIEHADTEQVAADEEECFKSRISALQESISTMSQQLANSESVIGQNLQLAAKVARLVEENAILQKRMVEMQLDHDQKMSTLETEIAENIMNAHNSHSEEEKRLQSEINAVRKENTALRQEIETTRQDNATLRIEAIETETELEDLRSRIEQSHSAQLDISTKERDLLISKLKDQKSNHANALSESKNAITILEAKVKDLTMMNTVLETKIKEANTTNTTLQTTFQKTTKDLMKTRQLLKISEFETGNAFKERQKVTRQLEALQEKTETVNREFDKKIEKLMREKEREWRERFRELSVDREMMGRVLMKEWGEKEIGVMVPKQGYRYKYV